MRLPPISERISRNIAGTNEGLTMTYRVQYQHGTRWQSVGLDCLDAAEVQATLAMVPQGAAVRVLRVRVR
jgi:hypothetical protein